MYETVLTGTVPGNLEDQLPGAVQLPPGAAVEVLGRYSMYNVPGDGLPDASQTGLVDCVVAVQGGVPRIVGQGFTNTYTNLSNKIAFEVVGDHLYVKVDNVNMDRETKCRVTLRAAAIS